MPVTRRSFLTTASMLAAGNALGLRPFGMLNALAETSSNYKALVCIFMFGGNDANNMLIPNDTAGYNNYAGIRGALALPQSSLLPLGTGGAFALHPSMPEVQALFNSNNAALLANVGTLLTPTSKSAYQAASVQTPTNLFSHPDQQLEWQNQVQDSSGTSGWAGRIADLLQTQMNPGALVPMIASIDGDTLFCNGTDSAPVSVGSGGPGNASCSDHSYCSSRLQAAQQLSALSSGVTIVQADNSITNNANTYNNVLTSAFSGVAALKTTFPSTPIANQLKEVAKLIQVQSALQVNRQIFFVSAGNFDTHAAQLTDQATLLQEISGGLGAFYQALEELGCANQVTAFTCSDFARTFQPNSTAGSDHAWGSHHIILGGAVKGGSIYGTFPTLELGGPNDVGTNGRWIPTTAAAQYAATLAQWFGVPTSDLSTVLPYIGNFSTSNLGFLG
jgi:uncharacterized protein (DUF1501 family)